MENYTLDALGGDSDALGDSDIENENLIDRSLMPVNVRARVKLQPIYSQRNIDELPDSSVHESGDSVSEDSFEPQSIQKLHSNENFIANHDEINSFLKKIESDEIEIRDTYDNEIVGQLIEYIKNLQTDLTEYSRKFYNLEIDFTELETEYLKKKQQLIQLQSENNIHRSFANEQKQELDNRVDMLTKLKSVELDQIQSTIDNETRVLHGLESEIATKSHLLGVLNDQYGKASPKLKKVKSRNLKGVTWADHSPTPENGDTDNGDVYESSVGSENEDLHTVLSKNNDLLNAKLIQKEKEMKEQDFKINQQLGIITELTEELKEYETVIRQLAEKLDSDQHNINDLKKEIEFKELVIKNKRLDRQDSLSRLTIKIGASTTRPTSAAGFTTMSIRSNESNESNEKGFYYPVHGFDWDSPHVRGGTQHSTGNGPNGGGLSPASTIKSNFTFRSAATNMNDTQHTSEAQVHEYLDELDKLRRDNVNMTQKLIETNNSKQRTLKDNKILKKEIKSLNKKFENLKSEFIENDKRVQLLNEQLKGLLHEHKQLQSEKKQPRNHRAARTAKKYDLEDANTEQLGGGSCVIFGSQFW